MFGFINVYKPKGMTSHDVVAKLRRVTGVKQIGHTGTLDPFAEGVLPICIGKATRLIEFLKDDKEYIATVQFGANTDTYDLEGVITYESNKKVVQTDVETALKNFEGEIYQVPPIYSALKVNGKKLYDYARQGQKVDIQPRKVFIKKIELLNFDSENQSAEILISCSKGTYIRSIAYDLGENLGCGGHLIKLIRTVAGNFKIQNSCQLETFDTSENVSKKLINPLDIIDLPKLNINETEHSKVLLGQHFFNTILKNNGIIILVYNNCVSAIAEKTENKIQVKKVFQ